MKAVYILVVFSLWMGLSAQVRTKGTHEVEEKKEVKPIGIPFKGTVTDAIAKQGVANLLVQLVDQEKRIVKNKKRTNKKGEFIFYIPPNQTQNLAIFIQQEGMPPLMVPIDVPKEKEIKVVKVRQSWSWMKF